MRKVFAVCNQKGQYLTKKLEWCSGKEPAQVFFKAHHDEALNQLCEINSKDIELRGKIVELTLDNKKLLIENIGPEPEVLENETE